MKKIITVFYSRKGENYWNGSIKNLEIGNTKRVAEMIQGAVGGDIFEVDSVKKYSDNYNECIEEAKDELNSGKLVEVKEYKDNLEDYDIIFVGYPNWWGTMPMVMFTFLKHYNLIGKKIIPFCTNEGSGMGTSERDLKKICKGADIEKGLSIHGAESEQSRDRVVAWANEFV
ncbi:flavodoxin [Clostridium sp. MSJ-8]|uniref:flavodoxin n=1 Tax=Clostridium sp. MSJ-8 TaxID=2841510 RepID=UPI001C0E9743|nr:flavodoxin [Clostridium sp. MSJ-8]MBU5487505.1 flavodoxin [Clostridium sp. MSJ-8]